MNPTKMLWREHGLSLPGRIKLPLALNGKVLLQKPRQDEVQSLTKNVASFAQNESCHL